MEGLVDDDVCLSHLDADERVVLEDAPPDAVGFVGQLERPPLVGLEAEVHLLHHVLDGLSIRRVVHEFEQVLRSVRSSANSARLLALNVMYGLKMGAQSNSSAL